MATLRMLARAYETPFPVDVIERVLEGAEERSALVGTPVGAPSPFAQIVGAAQAGAAFSDVRLKEDIKLIGQSPSGINIYNFNYKGDDITYQGVMAHQVPQASFVHDNGYLMVDYSKIDVEFKKVN